MKHGYQYEIELAVESGNMTQKLLRAQHKRVKVDRWRKLSKYLGRCISGRNDGATYHTATQWRKWGQERDDQRTKPKARG